MEQFYYHQNCKVCGRPMIVSSELLNAAIRCGHCGAICDSPQVEHSQSPPLRPRLNSGSVARSNSREQVGRVAALLRSIAPLRSFEAPLIL
ncbi:hypothetical protein EC9_38080 [Rosistilla ulvae]|uniref:Uncharacterized protein n=1 Tax=Rosistilla ulvae TaxID=1930277 RepID=A0A517M417_9BACT|nr:hypothetical protein EC9_38080 [Rosistilla ulvae]